MLIDNLLRLCVAQQASDLHLSPGHHPVLRIQGELAFLYDQLIMTATDMEMLLEDLLTSEEKQIFAKQLEFDFVYHANQLGRFRVHVYRQHSGVTLACRVIPEQMPTLAGLKLPAVFQQLVHIKNGLILITGPSGSGKSTTLAAMTNEINEQQARHIVTIEDPIEFLHRSKKSLITQRQITRDVHAYQAGLRAALREDPDIILLGELRDAETIQLALTAAETGHLVIATLHTSSAAGTINRLIDAFEANEKATIRHMLAASLQAVTSQMLVKSHDNKRTAIFEIMLATAAVKNLIREDKIAQLQNVIQTNGKVGMCTMEQSMTTLEQQKLVAA